MPIDPDEDFDNKIHAPFAKAISASGLVIIFYLGRLFASKNGPEFFSLEAILSLVVCATIIIAAFAYCYIGYYFSKKRANFILSCFLGLLALGMVLFVGSLTFQYL